MRYRNPRVVRLFLERFDLEPREANQLFGDVLRMLWLMATAKGDEFVPVISAHMMLDEMWHTFILDSPSYVRFCDEYLGGYVHHLPNFKTGTPSKAHTARERAGVDRLVERTVRELGPRVAVRWFETYLTRYGKDGATFYERHRIPLTKMRAAPVPRVRGRRARPSGARARAA